MVYDRDRREWMPLTNRIVTVDEERSLEVLRRADVWSGDYGTFEKREPSVEDFDKALQFIADHLGVTVEELKEEMGEELIEKIKKGLSRETDLQE